MNYNNNKIKNPNGMQEEEEKEKFTKATQP